MNALQRSRVNNIQFASMGTPDKAFVQSITARLKEFDLGHDRRPISIKQHSRLAQLCWKYRRQMPMECVPRNDPKTMRTEMMEQEMRQDRM